MLPFPSRYQSQCRPPANVSPSASTVRCVACRVQSGISTDGAGPRMYVQNCQWLAEEKDARDRVTVRRGPWANSSRAGVLHDRHGLHQRTLNDTTLRLGPHPLALRGTGPQWVGAVALYCPCLLVSAM